MKRKRYTEEQIIGIHKAHEAGAKVAELVREHARVLKPGGEIVITDWCHDYLACRVYDLILRCFNRAHFRTHGRGECRRLLEDSKFQSIDIERYKINWLWGLVTAKAQKRAA